MAYLAQLREEVTELVTAVTSTSQENAPQQFNALLEVALRSLRHHNYPQTNQFEVAQTLNGLEERFVVVGRDELAEALQQRRSALAEHTTNWTPEILHFLLELSDRPAEKASLDELNRICASKYVPEQPPLRWEDIAREDGWADELALWQNNDYASDEADDDYDDDEEDEEDVRSQGTDISSMDAQETQPETSSGLVLADTRSKEELQVLLQAVRDSQAWRIQQPQLQSQPDDPVGSKVHISELQLLREMLFMFQGLETTLFGTHCVPVDGFCLSGVSVETYDSLAGAVTTHGQRLLALRGRAAARGGPQGAVPLLQVFQEVIRHRLDAFDQELSKLHGRYVNITQDVIVSVAAVLDELQPSLSCLAALGTVVQQLEAERNVHAFRYVELLYDATALAQLDGRQALYEFLGTVFFQCFQVYLRPLRLWMEDGRLLEGDRVFFVAGAASQAVPSQVWQHQYKLLRTTGGALYAPRFLQPAVSTIFTTGKSIAVLRKLGKYDSQTRHGASTPAMAEPTLDFATVCPPGSELAPFSQLFSDAFERWMQSKYHAASATLKTTLFDSCGLWTSLQALQCVYLMSDGTTIDTFAERFFSLLDTKNPRWHDRYTVTELAREAFRAQLDAYRLSATVDETLREEGAGDDRDRRDPGDPGDPRNPARTRRSLRGAVARVQLHVRLAWPVQIIIPVASIASYQAIFTLLLQIRRTSSILSGHRLLDDGDYGDDGRADGDVRGAAQHAARRRRLPSGDRALYFMLRARLLWICNTLQTYLTTLVIAPNVEVLRVDLQRAVDVDAMIEAHAAFLKALLDESCLGSKLQPIHDCLLDLLDLTLRLEDARRDQAAREADQLQETWRLSVLSSPFHTPAAKKKAAAVLLSPSGGDSVRRRLFTSNHRNKDTGGDEEDQQDYSYDEPRETKEKGRGRQQSYREVLQAIRTESSSYLRFATGGLRGVARASSNTTAASKWNMLAEMLEAGDRDG